MIKSVFISKDFIEVQELAAFCIEYAIELNAQSLIKFKPVKFQPSHTSDCVFFSSPRSAEYYLTTNKIRKGQLIAAAGEATKKHLESFGYTVDFVPKNSGLTTQSSQEFSLWLGTKTVLFPISTISKKSYGSGLNPEQVEYTIVYETILVDKEVSQNDCYIFTSPSNVEAFLKTNNLPNARIIIAFGESTNDKLLEAGISNCIVLEKSSITALIEILKTLND